ncbi:hypothetical protein MCNS_32910 [Mycobacterium conspicuum]|uniref:Fucose-specific lectin n=1 Tax=Mycobacterium conspicuum TaxID=44010 RepID=A0A7I7YEL9_9MYCO|nr:hypothetical protein MCNS_32910 [Mycobacterium conspicuum]
MVAPGAWQTQDLSALTNAPAAALGGIAGYISQPDNTQHVLYANTAGHIVDLSRDGIGWHFKDLSAAASAPLSRLDVAGYAFQRAQHAVYLSTEHHIEDLWWDQSGTHVEDLTALTGSPLSSDAITGYGFEGQGTQHVFYRGWPDDQLHELWWDAKGWHYNDLAAVTGSVMVDLGSHPEGYVFQGTQHVFYRDEGAGHMHELSSDANGWHNNDLTAATGAPPSIGGFFSAYPFAAQGTQHVIYKSYPLEGTHLRELWSDHSGWHTDDLTAATGVAGSPWSVSGYAFEAQGTQHVIVDDNKFDELWWDRNGWHLDDLTAATGAPVSGGNGPIGYVVDGTQHVMYAGRNDKHIHELWWGPKASG